MKRILFLMALSILLVLTILLAMSTFLVSCNRENKLQFDLSKLPQKWVKLTKNEGNLVIFNPCNAANTMLSIHKNENGYRLVIDEGHKTFELKVVEAMKVADTLFLRAKWNWSESEKLQDIRFVWSDEENGIGHWVTVYSGGFTTDFPYVASYKKDSFSIVNEPCEACWGIACDEVLADKQTALP
ncbi:hypothetical protein [Galbibacter pacificus]|uniref:Lipoprotein n=1 Tax=Galbibacter pacificus TaxID=2996052 RepID=A0ABT6FNK6_9FLAO|nr:hypothetical protein [Galbibacter pacificus]MDG3581368.1 hypothetical protein [Galbibacter pacificus]MDG3584846.1 hypothetical protein [Galbibacter pacificus]